ncbi:MULTISPECIES: TetR/AcrR family transcriptional regulator [Paenibacillus]|uniref:TetR/AcrR family transcriptional regulator n=1 Tax=Paenibacillus illinoisensis TaxID=59845 RepID=UPI001C8E4C8F|nr:MULTISPECIES: TetR/AcrR family transcriptional regulator [Paenibacillus]MBY0215364.1 TetR/AcrR family transcriptional regulator [Paenibacillus illinoisensis]WJH29316.1 TetR/AcrR family transcriptional regulator [Paenibacillus sp. CC-CFT742]
MARNVIKDQQQRELRRNQVLSAAASVFSVRGVAVAKISDIATEAGLSYGHVYNFFESKEKILLALVQSSQERYTELLLEARGVSGTALDKLSWLIEQYLQKGSTSTNFWIVLQAQATEVLNPEEKAEINQTAKANRDLLADIIRDGQSEGTIVEGDAVELATLLLSLFQSTSIWGYRGFGEPSDHAADIMLRLVVRK